MNYHFGKVLPFCTFHHNTVCANRSYMFLLLYFFVHLIQGMPCIHIHIWFIKSMSSLYKKVKCVKKRGGREERVCVWEKGCCMVFFTSENVLSSWEQINDPSTTKHSAIKTTEYGRKQNHISEMNLVQYLRWHFLYLFLFSFIMLFQRAGGYILMCLQKKYTY